MDSEYMSIDEPITNEERFDGETIVKSKKYKRYADILTHFLIDGETYTHAEIDNVLNKALKQAVVKEVN